MWPPTTVLMTDAGGKTSAYQPTTCGDQHQLTHQLVIESDSDNGSGDVCCYGWLLSGNGGLTGNGSNEQRKPTYYLIVCLLIIGVVIMMLTICSAIIIFVQRKLMQNTVCVTSEHY